MVIFMKYARVVETIVVEVYVPPAGVPIEECFTPELVAQFEPCPFEVEANWIKQPDGTFTPPSPPAPEPTPEPIPVPSN